MSGTSRTVAPVRPVSSERECPDRFTPSTPDEPGLIQAFAHVSKQDSVRWRSEPLGMNRGTPIDLGGLRVANVTRDHHTRLCGVGRDGKVEWQSELKTTMNSSPVADDRGRVYVGTPEGLACLDGATGEKLWETDDYEMTRLCPPGTIEWDTDGGMGRPALSPDQKTVYFALLEGVVVALSTETGERRWHVSRPKTGYLNHPDLVVAPGGQVIYSDESGHLVGITPGGDVGWEHKLGKRLSQPAVTDWGTVCVINDEGKLLEFDPTDGSPCRSFELGEESRQSPRCASGRLYLAGENHLLCLEPRGEQLSEVWRRPLPKPAVSLAVGPEDTLCVGSRDEGLWFFDRQGQPYGRAGEVNVYGEIAVSNDGHYLVGGASDLVALRPVRLDLRSFAAEATAQPAVSASIRILKQANQVRIGNVVLKRRR